ncbi:MAG: hypothetical protein RIK87_27895 [Fuerstiella sp.]
MLTDQFVEATNYVQANGKSATLGGLSSYLDGKNLSIAPTAVLAATKVGLNTPDLLDSKNNLKVSTAQCVADVTEMAFDVSLLVVEGVSVVGWVGAAVTGVGLVAQLYATGVSCGNAAVQGIHAVGRITGKAAREMAVIRGRIVGYVNRFIADASKSIAAEYSPSKHDYSRMPKPAKDELQLGLLSSLMLAELLPPLQVVKNISTTKVSAADAAHIGRAVLLMYKLEKSSDATFSTRDEADAKKIAGEFAGLNLAAAYNKFFGYGTRHCPRSTPLHLCTRRPRPQPARQTPHFLAAVYRKLKLFWSFNERVSHVLRGTAYLVLTRIDQQDAAHRPFFGKVTGEGQWKGPGTG